MVDTYQKHFFASALPERELACGPRAWPPDARQTGAGLVYNASASAPLGFYRLIAADHLARGDLVLAHLPESAARLAADRRYLLMSVPVVKRIAAVADDLVCADSGIVVINEHVAADTLLIDREGRPLPAWKGCRSLVPGEVFLLMEGVPASFDSRYFGPVPMTSVIGRLVPLWTW